MITEGNDPVTIHKRLWGKPSSEPRVLRVKQEPPKPRQVTAIELAVILGNKKLDWNAGVKAILSFSRQNLQEVIGRYRGKTVVECRRTVANYLRSRGWTYEQIGQFLHRDRTTIMNLVNPEGRRLTRARYLDRAANTPFEVFGADGWTVPPRYLRPPKASPASKATSAMVIARLDLYPVHCIDEIAYGLGTCSGYIRATAARKGLTFLKRKDRISNLIGPIPPCQDRPRKGH